MLLLQILDYHEILRLYTAGHDPKKIEKKEYIRFSNFDVRTKNFEMPGLQFIYSHRVVICTLAVAGNLTRGNKSSLYKPDHFSHVIIDESACALETMTMIAIAGKYSYIRTSIHIHMLILLSALFYFPCYYLDYSSHSDWHSDVLTFFF